jgi:hypothetical protein
VTSGVSEAHQPPSCRVHVEAGADELGLGDDPQPTVDRITPIDKAMAAAKEDEYLFIAPSSMDVASA